MGKPNIYFHGSMLHNMQHVSSALLHTMQYDDDTDYATFRYMFRKSEAKHPNNIKKLRTEAGLSQQAIANVWGVERGDVSRIENGKNSITTDKRKLLTKHFGWTAEQILGDDIPPTIPLVGNVGAGSKIYPIDDYHKGGSMEQVEAPPVDSKYDQAKMVAVRVEGDSMLPVMRHGWVIYYCIRHEGGCDALVNEMAIVESQGRRNLR